MNQTLAFYEMYVIPTEKNLLVFDTRINQLRCVTLRDDGRLQEENGRCYHPNNSPYLMWAALNTQPFTVMADARRESGST